MTLKSLRSAVIDILAVILSLKLCCFLIVWILPATATSSWMIRGMAIESFMQPFAWTVLIATNIYYWRGLYKCKKNGIYFSKVKAGFRGFVVIATTLFMIASLFGYSPLEFFVSHPKTHSHEHMPH